MQNIPSHNKEIRMLFRSKIAEHITPVNDNVIDISFTDEVETTEDWKKIKELVIGDILIITETDDNDVEIINNYTVKDIIYFEDTKTYKVFI